MFYTYTYQSLFNFQGIFKKPPFLITNRAQSRGGRRLFLKILAKLPARESRPPAGSFATTLTIKGGPKKNETRMFL